MKVIQHNKPEKYYGLFNGIYSSRFHSPGLSGDSLGTICSDPSYPASCNFIKEDSVDFQTGTNPYKDSLGEANAFCDEEAILNSCNEVNFSNIVEELYLVDQTGTKK